MRSGLVQSRREFAFDSEQEDRPAFLSSVLQLYYTGTTDPPREIYVPIDPADKELLEKWLSAERPSVRILVPRRGVKARFLELVRKNAKLAFDSRFRSPYTYGVEVLEALQEALGLSDTP